MTPRSLFPYVIEQIEFLPNRHVAPPRELLLERGPDNLDIRHEQTIYSFLENLPTRTFRLLTNLLRGCKEVIIYDFNGLTSIGMYVLVCLIPKIADAVEWEFVRLRKGGEGERSAQGLM
jgi:hypothetical protein